MQTIGIASTSTSLLHISPAGHRRRWSHRGALLIAFNPHHRSRYWYGGSIYTSRRRTIVAMCQQQPPDDDEDNEGSSSGKLVDENMLTLRRRIGELREVVGGKGVGPVEDDDDGETTDRRVGTWTKKASKKHRVTLYHTDLLDVMALVQLSLQRKREDEEDNHDEEDEGGDLQHQTKRPMPAKVGVGVTLMVTLTIPVSVIVIALHVMDAAKLIIDGIHSVQSLQK